MDLPKSWVVGLIGLAALNAGIAGAQVPPPPPTSPTLWSFLGIPQAAYKLNAQLFNRRGNFPALEKKPPLKAIADVANLKSDVPAIKAAAEIKQAEDLKPQKVKAIKYLATIGCGCYDKDEKVTKALLAAMEDCTEDVRLTAVRAVAEAAQSERCAQCKQRSCCNEKLVNQLSKMAYDRDDTGCYVEPSERVREAAVEAMCICCPGGPPPVEEAAPTPTPVPVEGTEVAPPREGTGAESAPPPPMLDSTLLFPPRNPPWSRPGLGVNPARPVPPAFAPPRSSPPRFSPPTATRRQFADGPTNPDPSVLAVRHLSSAPEPIRQAADQLVTGHVVHTTPDMRFVHLHLNEGGTLSSGTAVKVYQRSAAGGRIAAVFQVTNSEPGWANARLTGNPPASKIAQGSEFVAWR